MGKSKEKRRGGARDDSEVYISYSRRELMKLIADTDSRLGVGFNHNFPYHFKKHKSIPKLWQAYKRTIRKYIDGRQLELPLFL